MTRRCACFNFIIQLAQAVNKVLILSNVIVFLAVPWWDSSWSKIHNDSAKMQSIIKNETMLDRQRLKPGTMRSPVQNDAVSLHHHIRQHYHKLRQHWWQPKWILTTELKAHFYHNTAGFSGLEGNLGDRMVINSVMPFLRDKSDPNQPSQSAHSAIRGTPSTRTILLSSSIVLMDL